MSREDWFRNTSWSADIAEEFERRLARSRSGKPQYLRIQAYLLAQEHPTVALALIDRYFQINDHFDDASAYGVQATAYLAIGDPTAAVASWEAAFSAEARRPHVKTSAWIPFTEYVIAAKRADLYGRAVYVSATKNLVFAHELFAHAAIRAVAADHESNHAEAARWAKVAIEAAQQKRSPFVGNPHIGLVGSDSEPLVETMRRILSNRRPWRHRLVRKFP